MSYLTTTAPYVTFCGPENGIIYQKDPSGQKIPRFAARNTSSKEKSIQRLMPNGSHVPVATSTTSTLSGTTKVSMQGSKFKMEPSWEGMAFRIDMKNTPVGHLRWWPDSVGHGMKLKDVGGSTLAAYQTKSWSGKELTMEIFAKGDDSLVEMIMVSAICLKKKLG